MPKVSVLLTSYNHRDFLPLAVESLRAQTFKDFEILALDDGSTDGSREWIADQSDLIPHFHPKNLGTYGNLNFGIEHSTGEYIAVFNDDDLWGPEKIAQQVQALDSNPKAGLVHTAGWFIDDQGNEIPGAPLGFPWPKTESGEVFPELIERNKIIASSVMFRRSIIKQVGLFEPGFWGCGDWDMWLRIAQVSEVVHIDQPLTFYRVHPNQACRFEDRMNEDGVVIRTKLAKIADDMAKISARHQQAFAHNFAALGTEMMWRGNRAEARRNYLESLRLNPLRFKSILRLVATYILPTRVFKRLG